MDGNLSFGAPLVMCSENACVGSGFDLLFVFAERHQGDPV